MFKDFKGNKFFKKVNILDIFYVNLYFGKDGFRLNNFFINLVKDIEFLFYLLLFRVKVWVIVILWVFIVEYDFLFLKILNKYDISFFLVILFVDLFCLLY